MEVDLSATLGQSDVPGWFGMANTLIVCVFVVEARRPRKCPKGGVKSITQVHVSRGDLEKAEMYSPPG